jgi:hypothetical protein
MLLLFRPANALNSVDAAGCYAWIRSAVIDGDLDTRNDFLERVKGQICGRHPKHPDRCDYRDNPYGIGTALFLSPFSLLAHFLASFLVRRETASPCGISFCVVWAPACTGLFTRSTPS